jgi:hypothetical protein
MNFSAEMDNRTQFAVQKIVGVMLEEQFRQVNREWDAAWDEGIQVEGSMRGGTWTSPGFIDGTSYGDWFHQDGAIIITCTDN